MLEFKFIKEAFEYKGTDEVVIVVADRIFKRHINPDKSIGGYIDSTSSIDDTCYIGDDCIIFDNVRLKNHVIIIGNVHINNNVYIRDNVKISNGVMINNNVRICRNVNIINGVRIFNGVGIYDNVEIYDAIRICNGAIISNGSHITKQEDFMTVNNVGSRNSTVTFTKDKDSNILVYTGCFNGTEEEFIKAVNKTHGDNIHGKIYMNLLETFKLRQIV